MAKFIRLAGTLGGKDATLGESGSLHTSGISRMLQRTSFIPRPSVEQSGDTSYRAQIRYSNVEAASQYMHAVFSLDYL